MQVINDCIIASNSKSHHEKPINLATNINDLQNLKIIIKEDEANLEKILIKAIVIRKPLLDKTLKKK